MDININGFTMFRCFTELGTDLLARTNEENNCHIVSQKARLGSVHGSLGIRLWPKMYTNLTGSSVADESYVVSSSSHVFSHVSKDCCHETRRLQGIMFFCCSAPYRRAPLKVLRANVCDNSWVAGVARKGWQPMVAPIFSGGFIFGPFWLTSCFPLSRFYYDLQSLNLDMAMLLCYLSLGCWAPELFSNLAKPHG